MTNFGKTSLIWLLAGSLVAASGVMAWRVAAVGAKQAQDALLQVDKSEADLNNREQENWYDTTNEAINLKHKIQAKLLVGFNNKQVTKTFRDRADLDKWVDENDAEILSTRSLENANIIGDMVFDKSDFKESTITEKAPPGMEQWVKHNKAKFKKEYGDKKGEEVLYATAWKMAKESIENLANSLLEKFDSFK